MKDFYPMQCLCCGVFTRREDKHCFTCYQLYVKKRLCINGRWWHVRTSGALDAFVLPALCWEMVAPIGNSEILEILKG